MSKHNLDLQREVWEGWTVQAFIDELEYQVNIIMNGQAITKKFENKQQLKDWCKDNQPYYKKTIPEVVTYFANKFNLK